MKMPMVDMPGQMPRPQGRPMTEDECRMAAQQRAHMITASMGGAFSMDAFKPMPLPDIARKPEGGGRA